MLVREILHIHSSSVTPQPRARSHVHRSDHIDHLYSSLLVLADNGG